MNKKNAILFFTFTMLLSSIATLSLPKEIFAQVFPFLGKNDTGKGLTDALKNSTSDTKNSPMNLIDQANSAIRNNTLGIITAANDALRNSPLNIIDQANDALRNSPLNIIDQANDAFNNRISQDQNTSKGIITQAAVNKLENVYSLTNMVGMSMVDGIKVNEIAIGENNVTATLNYQPTQNDTEDKSVPVTIVVTKLPAANLTQLVYLASAATNTASAFSSDSGSIESIIESTNLTPETLSIALQSLDLIKNLQSGMTSATLSNLDSTQKISIQTPGGLLSSISSSPNEFVTVLVVPSLGSGPIQSPLPSILAK